MKFRRITHRIWFRLLLSAVGLVLLGAVLRYAVLWKFLLVDLEKQAAVQQLALATHMAQDIDQRVRLRQLLLDNLAQALPRELLLQPELLRIWLDKHHGLLPLFSSGILVLNPTGKAVTAYPGTTEHVGGVPSAALATAFSGDRGIGRPITGSSPRQSVLPLKALIRDADGTVRGSLVGLESLDASGMLNMVLNGRFGQSGGFLLISPQDSLFVAASDPQMTLKPTPAPGINALHDRAMAGYRGTGVTVNAKGVEELSAIASIPSTGWFVVARMPTAEAFATLGRIQAYMVRNSFIVAIVALLLVGVLAFWLLKPLLNAARQAEKMTQGDAPLEPLKVERDDEVGDLTTAFNRLLVKLLQSQEELVHLAHHDSLTGLPNRRLLTDRLAQALARANRSGLHLALLFMDLDGFKAINDTLGHDAGDQALCEVAKRFAAVIRQNDTLARVGGDEFVLLICDLGGNSVEMRQIVETIAAKCQTQISEPLVLCTQPASLGVSIGIAISDTHSTPDDLMNAADTAMYKAKHQGRGVTVFSNHSERQIP